jgi:hypothetical protein
MVCVGKIRYQNVLIIESNLVPCKLMRSLLVPDKKGVMLRQHSLLCFHKTEKNLSIAFFVNGGGQLLSVCWYVSHVVPLLVNVASISFVLETTW